MSAEDGTAWILNSGRGDEVVMVAGVGRSRGIGERINMIVCITRLEETPGRRTVFKDNDY